MWVRAAVMIVTALWIVLGAVLHGGNDIACEVAGQAWWWESSARSTGLACYHALPPTHPLARLLHSPWQSIG
jgi:hypothetical protein